MFIKKTTKKDPNTGKIYSTFNLVESVRTENGPRQRIILYMGADVGAPENEHPYLAQCISELLNNESSLIPYPEHIRHLAQQYVSQIVHRLSTSECAECNEPKTQSFISIDVNSIEKSEPRSVGAEHLMLQMAHQLKLPEQFKKLGFSDTEVALALGSIIGRAVSPNSELSTYAWLRHESGLGELIDFDFERSSLYQLYRISDKLLPHKETLERYLEEVEQKFHGYTNTIALYDLTNTYMEGQNKANSKAQFGVSKEKRSDCPLVTLGLVMNEHGFLHRTSILPGNAAEPATLENMIQQLTVHSQGLFKPTIVLDAGIATEANLAWLREHNYFYVVSARQNAPSLELGGELVPVGDAQDLVRAALIKSTSDNEERWLYCESEAKAAVASKMKQSFRRRFEDELKNIAASLLKPKGRKKYTKVLERIGRLKEKHKRISGCYEIDVTTSEDGKTATSITWRAIEEKLSDRLNGNYFLRSNLGHLEAKELWQIYNTLRRVEDAFRFMKSSLGLRPVYHQKEGRVDGHLWITIMAYHLIQHCLYQLQQKEIHYHWKTVRKIMRSRVRVTMRANMENGKVLYHRSTTKAEGEQADIYRALSLSSSILRTCKTTV